MSDVSKLKEIALFKNMDGPTLKSLASVLSEVKVSDGQVVFREDDKSDEIYFIYSGAVDVVKTVNRQAGTSQPLSSLGQGEFFGEMALFDQKKRSATVTAKGDTALLKLARKDFNYFLKHDAKIAADVLGGMLLGTVKRLRDTDIGYVTIYETGRMLAAEKNTEKLLKAILDKIIEVAPGADKGFIALWNEFSEMFEARSMAGYSAGDITLQKNDVIIKQLKENKERLYIDNTSTTSLFDQNTMPGYCGASFLAHPLVHLDELLGFFLVSNASTTVELSSSQINLISGIASQMAPVIANAKKITEEENRRRLERSKMIR